MKKKKKDNKQVPPLKLNMTFEEAMKKALSTPISKKKKIIKKAKGR